jgi:hypothetical protein
VTKELLSERDLDELGFFCKRHRERLIKEGKFPEPIRFGNNNSKRFYTRESIEAYKLAASSAEATAA